MHTVIVVDIWLITLRHFGASSQLSLGLSWASLGRVIGSGFGLPDGSRMAVVGYWDSSIAMIVGDLAMKSGDRNNACLLAQFFLVCLCPRSLGLWWGYWQAAVHKMMPHSC
jgi:hypothetical protein